MVLQYNQNLKIIQNNIETNATCCRVDNEDFDRIKEATTSLTLLKPITCIPKILEDKTELTDLDLSVKN